MFVIFKSFYFHDSLLEEQLVEQLGLPERAKKKPFIRL